MVRHAINFERNIWMEHTVSKGETLQKCFGERRILRALILHKARYSSPPNQGHKIIKNPSSPQESLARKGGGVRTPSSPSSPNRRVMRSSLYEGLTLVDDLGSLSLLGASP